MAIRSTLSELDITTIVCKILWWFVEVLRLYVGQQGNVEEKVPSLAAFTLLSLVPQLPIVIYLGFFQEADSITDTVLASLMLVILVPEIIISHRTLRLMIKAQTEAFYQNYEHDQEQLRIEREQKEADVLYWTRELNALENENSSSSRKK